MKSGAFLILFGGIVFIIAGCASFSVEKFHSDSIITPKLPFLTTVIDTVSFEKHYPAVFLGNVDRYSRGKLVEKQAPIWTTPYRRFDAIDLITMEMQENICEASDTAHGYAVWRILAIDKKTNAGWFITSTFTLYLINLFGYPLFSQTAYVDIEMEIQDTHMRPVAAYTASAKGTAYVAMWWGYWNPGIVNLDREGPDVTRASNLDALKKAIQDIKKQVRNDALKIESRLGRNMSADSGF
jgi:hypothetical protein